MIKDLKIRTCVECNKIFRTPKNEQLCPTCREKHKKATQKAIMEKQKAIKIVEEEPKEKPRVSLREEQRIERIYNAIHKSRYHGYSEIVNIIENTEVDRCVCCGNIIPEGRMVCVACEKEADNA